MDFFDKEAEESDDEDYAIAQAKKRAVISSDEDDEDEDGLDENLEGLIDDNPDLDNEESGSGSDGEEADKRKHEESELDEDLSDDDYALIEENLGIKVKRKPHKRKRIKVMSDDEDSNQGEAPETLDDQEAIANELFQGEDEEEPPADGDGEPAAEKAPPSEIDVDISEESDVDDFIVDDEGKPITKKKKHIIHDDKALQEAQDIFGVDFDFEEFEQYGEYDEDEEDEEEDADPASGDKYEEEAAEDVGEDGEVVVRPSVKKSKKNKRAAKSTIYDVFEPTELERGFFTDMDQDIRMADLPERFQLRRVKVCPMEEGEMEEEADWIFKWAFSTPPLSQTESAADGQTSSFTRRDPSMVTKIQEALKFMRNQQFEVPFIAFYRKEYVEPELNINDLWKVYNWDEKWMQLRNRKMALLRLMDKMQQWQFEQIDPDQPLDSNFRTLTEEDKIRVKGVQSMEELRDVYQHFLLYYGPDIPKMKNAAKERRRRARLEADGDEPDGDEDDEPMDALKQATRKSSYTLCQTAGLAEVAQKFGLTPEEFGENLRDNYQRHDVEQDPAEPDDLGAEYIKGQFKTPNEVLKGAVHMVAMQIGHDPLVRQVVRQVYYERAKIVIRPTKKGMKEIDESHSCYQFKYIINKPIKDLADDMFLKIVTAEADGQLTFKINIDREDPVRPENEHTSAMPSTYFDEIKSLYHRDEFSHLVQEWNNLREEAVKRAFELILYPSIVKDLKVQLLEESKMFVIKSCKDKLYNWLKVAAYTPDHNLEDDDEEMDTSNGVRVMGVSFSDAKDEAAFAVIIDGDGVVTDYIRLPHLTKRKKAWRKDEREHKEHDLENIKEFIRDKHPHVIGVGATSRGSLNIVEDIKEVVNELEQETDMSPISVELVDIELATVFMNSNKGIEDYREYPALLRQSVSIARRLQDPLLEFCQLCNPDEDILALKFHPLQDLLNKDTLLESVYLEFINRVNEVGVDVNRCVAITHMAPLIQFVCGLGPRKGYHLIKTLKQNNSRLENRTQLVTMCHMGPKVFINCAGFIKIDTNSLGDSTEAYVEVLDGSRVHPETYEWARKMAVDALEYDDQAEDANPAGALEEILESPERLKDLDLDAFAEELERQGYGNRHITLYDIRAELNHRYKDMRKPFTPPSIEERFVMLTKETPASFYCGKLILGRVSNIAHRKPRGEELDNADPVRNDETGLWLCPFCRQQDFAELSDVWNHFDAGECPGQSVGVKIRLDNDITGFIPLKNLSDKHVKDPEERVKIGMSLHCRITKIDPERFNIEATSKSSDLADKENKWRLGLDNYYDYALAEQDRAKEENKKKQQARQTYIKRVIAHPSFQNIDFKTCERHMASLEQGEVIIRPSSKGADHLTVTLKIADNIHQHIDVMEKGKENAFSLGQSLWIGNEEFEDLDEIIARHIQPIAAFARDILNYKYYIDSSGGKREIVDQVLREEKAKGPSKIPYYFHATKDYPGKFVLSYLPRKNTIHEYISIVPDGIRYRGTTFHSLSSVIRWFKEHFRDPIPGTPQSMARTPMGLGAQHTPRMRSVDPAAIQRAAAGLPSSLYNTLAQVTGGTPGGAYPAGAYGAGYQTGYNYQPQQATPMMTPLLTPSYHGQQAAPVTPSVQRAAHMTPQYQLTPRAAFAHPGATPHRTPQHAGGTPQRAPGTGSAGSSSANTPASGATPSPSRRSHGSSTNTPRGYAGTTPRSAAGRTPGSRTPQSAAAKATPTTAMDWAKMAEMWAKQRNEAPPPAAGTKAAPPLASPRSPPQGDATPLFDER